MTDQFIYCPQCGSDAIEDCDYEDGEGEPTEDVFCEDCGWEGVPAELVCQSDDDDGDDAE